MTEGGLVRASRPVRDRFLEVIVDTIRRNDASVTVRGRQSVKADKRGWRESHTQVKGRVESHW